MQIRIRKMTKVKLVHIKREAKEKLKHLKKKERERFLLVSTKEKRENINKQNIRANYRFINKNSLLYYIQNNTLFLNYFI